MDAGFYEHDKIVKRKFTVSFKPSSIMSFKNHSFMFQSQFNSDPTILSDFCSDMSLTQSTVWELLKCLNKLHSSYLITVVL